MSEPSSQETPPAEPPKYVVAFDFNDASGKLWRSGQPYDGTDQEAQQLIRQGLVTDTFPVPGATASTT